MDQNNGRETHDFMSIESFSQLPLLRPSKEKGGIRLFGKEFGGGGGATNDHSDDQNNNGGGGGDQGEVSNKELSNVDNGDTSSRRFECHYCWRNFPTSQALGGHQNAHKRERQNAKRAHLQSLMVHGGVSMDAAAAHDYGVMSYGRTLPLPLPLPPPYQSWRPYGSHATYNAHHQQQQPQPIINGRPLSLWRIPAAPAPTPFAQERIHRQINPLINPAKERVKQPLSTSTHQGSSSQLANESKPAMHDHLSLDLHL